MKTVGLTIKISFGHCQRWHHKSRLAVNFLTRSAPKRLPLSSANFYVKHASQMRSLRPSGLPIDVVLECTLVRIWIQSNLTNYTHPEQHSVCLAICYYNLCHHSCFVLGARVENKGNRINRSVKGLSYPFVSTPKSHCS
jgi:hypothetical protein